MEDYSDKTLRALIKQLIKEDTPNKSADPRSYSKYRAIPSAQMLNFLKAIFSKEGFVALTAAGLIFETEFTKGLMSFGFNQASAAIDAVKAYNEVADKGGSTLDRIGAASATFKDKSAKNKYLYLKDLKAIKEKNKSFTAEVVYDIMTNANKTYGFNRADPGSVSVADGAIIAAILDGEIERVFDGSQFKLSGKTLSILDENDEEVNSSTFDYESAANNAAEKQLKPDGLWINRLIILELKEANSASENGKLQKYEMHMNNAIAIYNSSSELLETPGDELEKITVLGRLDEIEEGLESNFERTIRSFGKSTEEKFVDLVSFTARSAKEALLNK